jgi:hypothetical protein
LIEHGTGRAGQFLLFDISNDADNFEYGAIALIMPNARANAFPNWILSREAAFSESLIDNRDWGGLSVIVFIEETAVE